MANHNTKKRNAETRRQKQHFHGKACITGFDGKNPENKRKSAWQGMNPPKR